MSIANWIAIFGVAVTGVIPLVIAYMHRKQMRQLELHRLDPNIPVIPPHGVTVSLKRY